MPLRLVLTFIAAYYLVKSNTKRGTRNSKEVKIVVRIKSK